MWHLLLLWSDILKVDLIIWMALRHWNQDKWEAIPSKNHVREECLRFSDKQLIYSTDIFNLACPISMRFCHFQRHQNHRAWYSERASDIGFFVIFIVYVWCVFLLLGAIGSLKFCCGTSQPSLLSIWLYKSSTRKS